MTYSSAFTSPKEVMDIYYQYKESIVFMKNVVIVYGGKSCEHAPHALISIFEESK